MWWCSTPTAFYVPPPPLSLEQKACGPLEHEKHPGFGSSNRLRKPRCPVRRILVNRDPFRDLGFRAALKLHRPAPGSPEASILRQKFLVPCG